MSKYNDLINNHYGPIDISERILEKLLNAGKDVEALTRDDLSLFDEFHGGGRKSTRSLAKLAGLKPGMKVLDLGCGVGGPARTLAAEFGCQVTGLDLTEEFCRAAEMLTAKVGLDDKIEFKHGSALDMPFEDESFDAVWAQNMDMNIEDKQGLIREISRVLKPKGLFAFETVLAGEVPDIHLPIFWADSPSINFLIKPDEKRRLLSEAGLREILWEDKTDEYLQTFLKRQEKMKKDGPPKIGVGLLVPNDAGPKMKNYIRNKMEGRMITVFAVYAKEE